MKREAELVQALVGLGADGAAAAAAVAPDRPASAPPLGAESPLPPHRRRPSLAAQSDRVSYVVDPPAPAASASPRPASMRPASAASVATVSGGDHEGGGAAAPPPVPQSLEAERLLAVGEVAAPAERASPLAPWTHTPPPAAAAAAAAVAAAAAAAAPKKKSVVAAKKKSVPTAKKGVTALTTPGVGAHERARDALALVERGELFYFAQTAGARDEQGAGEAHIHFFIQAEA